MSLYYVYMCWSGETDGENSWSGHLLTCESRYVADEFFRACQDFVNVDGQPWFSKLERSNPQFWIYDCTDSDPYTAPASVLGRGTLPPSVQGRVIWTDLQNSLAHKWSIPPTVPGRDWVNGNTYYVRNIRQPNLYWTTISETTSSGRILVSCGGPQTKFRVVGTELGSDKRVLIRSDVVRLGIPQTNPVQYLRCGNNSLKYGPDLRFVSGDPGSWAFRFGDLLGKFGIVWSTGDYRSWQKGDVMWDAGGNQDEWELC